MSHQKVKLMTGTYDAGKLQRNLQEHILLEEDEDGSFAQGDQVAEEILPINPLLNKSEPKVYPIEINLEDLEKANGIEDDWEHSLLKIIESSEVSPKLSWDDEFESDSYEKDKKGMRGPKQMKDIQNKYIVEIDEDSLKDVLKVLSAFEIREGEDFNVSNNKSKRVKIVIEKRGTRECNKIDVTGKSPQNEAMKEDRSKFDQIMDQFQRGIRIKKKFGKGYVKMNADNMPGTYHELYSVVSGIVDENTTEDMIKYLFRKSKSFKAMGKMLNIDEIILC
ncbi:polymerase-associated protein P [Berrimah virus]|uniref:Polymerase-associated protein P n=2 Tax=Berrimah virus TaxID=318834 RepID=I3NUX5_9RHAB|nr:polymerase-associated protein P [Berrimah virus]AEH58017.1 polymerase-associated protein P [Berrimah virus]